MITIPSGSTKSGWSELLHILLLRQFFKTKVGMPPLNPSKSIPDNSKIMVIINKCNLKRNIFERLLSTSGLFFHEDHSKVRVKVEYFLPLLFY